MTVEINPKGQECIKSFFSVPGSHGVIHEPQLSDQQTLAVCHRLRFEISLKISVSVFAEVLHNKNV